MRFMAYGEKVEGMVKHHLLPVSTYPEYRDEPMNHVWLSAYDHTMNGECCPHGTLPEIRASFNRWVRDNMPDRFEWMVGKARRRIDCGKE